MIGATALAIGLGLGDGAWPAAAASAFPISGGYFSATLLADSRVLIIVSGSGAQPTLRAEIYDPSAHHWTPASIDREARTVTALADGRVMLMGCVGAHGGGDSLQCAAPGLYDPKSDTISTAAVPIAPDIIGYSSTLLRSGKVLVAGVSYPSFFSPPLATAELYDPATNTWSAAAPMRVVRKWHRAIRLADGQVMLVGGDNEAGQGAPTPDEIYDPASNTWSAAAAMTIVNGSSDALSLLGNGMVLAAGGVEDGMPSSSAEAFNPATRTWSRTARMTFGRYGASSALLPDGRVLVLGGLGLSGLPLTTGEIFNPNTNTWILVPGPLGARYGSRDQAALPLKDGRLLVAGWSDHWSSADAEIFDPLRPGTVPTPTPTPTGPGTWSSATSTTDPHMDHTATLLADGRVLVLGVAHRPVSPTPTALRPEIYDPSTGRWSRAASPSTILSFGFTTTLLASGKVLAVGGGAELYDPSSDSWSPTGPMTITPTQHAVARLADGRVLIAGGAGNRPGAVEIYEPASNSWSVATYLPENMMRGGLTATPLRAGRVLFIVGGLSRVAIYDSVSNTWSTGPSPIDRLYADYTVTAHFLPSTTTVLPSGKVLVLGNYFVSNNVAFPASQVYDPQTNQWTSRAAMVHSRVNDTATLLRRGLVLVTGGDDQLGGARSVMGTSELYDPASNRWSPTGSLAVPRSGHTATLLKDGTVLVAGGSFLDSLGDAELYTPPALPAKSAPLSAWPLRAVIPLGIAVLISLAAILILAIRRRRLAAPR
jgi:N-acetylneuraminic acid mutarotase